MNILTLAFGDVVQIVSANGSTQLAQQMGMMTVVTGLRLDIEHGIVLYKIDGRPDEHEISCFDLMKRCDDESYQSAVRLALMAERAEAADGDTDDNDWFGMMQREVVAEALLADPAPARKGRQPLAVLNGDADPAPAHDNSHNWGFRGRVAQRNLDTTDAAEPNAGTFFDG
jgi:hypothetical protein